jgi:hypothetical protein
MANQRRRDRQRSRAGRGEQSQVQFSLPYDRRNGIVFAVAIALILVGYLCMAQPPVDGFLSLTLAPILLVIGYIFLIPMALLMKSNQEIEAEASADRNPQSDTAAQ